MTTLVAIVDGRVAGAIQVQSNARLQAIRHRKEIGQLGRKGDHMGVASLDLRAIADAIVALARRAVEQRGELEAQSKRLSLLESAVADVADRRGPPPLQIKRTSSSTAEALTKSFEARLAARPDEDD